VISFDDPLMLIAVSDNEWLMAVMSNLKRRSVAAATATTKSGKQLRFL
jgi:hypothetical protein